MFSSVKKDIFENRADKIELQIKKNTTALLILVSDFPDKEKWKNKKKFYEIKISEIEQKITDLISKNNQNLSSEEIEKKVTERISLASKPESKESLGYYKQEVQNINIALNKLEELKTEIDKYKYDLPMEDIKELNENIFIIYENSINYNPRYSFKKLKSNVETIDLSFKALEAASELVRSKSYVLDFHKENGVSVGECRELFSLASEIDFFENDPEDIKNKIVFSFEQFIKDHPNFPQDKEGNKKLFESFAQVAIASNLKDQESIKNSFYAAELMLLPLALFPPITVAVIVGEVALLALSTTTWEDEVSVSDVKKRRDEEVKKEVREFSLLAL